MIVGVMGGGQLARMLALAGYPLGLEFIFLDPAEDACANYLGEALHGPYDDDALLTRMAERADVVTYEFENVPAASVRALEGRVAIHPSAEPLAIAQDRIRQKQLFRENGIPTPAHVEVYDRSDLDRAVEWIGYPLVVKTRSHGYDGKGQAFVTGEEDLSSAWERLGGRRLLAEERLAFTREVSIVAARGLTGETAFYSISENRHEGGILRSARVRAGDPLEPRARECARRLLTSLDYVGVLALELFDVNGELVANELAPRVHNSGHWTIEGAETSQFENHLRAILGWPLGPASTVGEVAMLNCIGALPDPAAILGIPGAHLHLYGKQARPGRKLGHVTVRARDAAALEAALSEVTRAVRVEPTGGSEDR